MFIRLTKRDGTPIWLNSNFVVTVEPVRNGGAIVVPVGDGLDYDVRESVESIISMLGDPSVPAVTPVPVTDALPVSEAEPAAQTIDPPVFENVDVPSVSEAQAAAAVAAAIQLAPKPAAEEKPAKRTRKAKARPAPAGMPATEGERKMPKRRSSARKPAIALTGEQMDRLHQMAPRSVKRLANALKSHFAVENPDETVRALVENDIILVDEQNHITWL